MITRKLTSNQMVEDLFLAMSVLDSRDAGRKILLRAIREISTGSYNRAWGHIDKAIPYIKEPISLDAIRRVGKELKMRVTNDVVVLPSREIEAIFNLASLGHSDLAASLELYMNGADFTEAQTIVHRIVAGDSLEQTNLYLDRDVDSPVFSFARALVQRHAAMLPKYVYEDLTAGISAGKSFDELEIAFAAKHPGFSLTKEHYDLVTHQVTALDEDGFDKQLEIEDRIKKQTKFNIKLEKKEKAKAKPKTRMEEDAAIAEEKRETGRKAPNQVSHDEPKDTKDKFIGSAVLKNANVTKEELVARISEKITAVMRGGTRAAQKFFSIFLKVAGAALAFAIFLAIWYALSKAGILSPRLSNWKFKDVKDFLKGSPEATKMFIRDIPSKYAYLVEKLLWAGPSARWKMLGAIFVTLKLNWIWGVGQRVFKETFDRQINSFSITKLGNVDSKVDMTLQKMGSAYKNMTFDQEKKHIGRSLLQVREQLAVALYEKFPENIGQNSGGRKSVSVEDVVFDHPPHVQLLTTLNGNILTIVVFYLEESKYMIVSQISSDSKPTRFIGNREKVVGSMLRYVSERITEDGDRAQSAQPV